MTYSNNLKTIGRLTSLFGFVLASISSFGVFFFRQPIANADPVGCSPSYSIFINGTSGTTTTLSGNVQISVNLTTAPLVPIQSVLFSIDGLTNIIGRGVQQTGTSWIMYWVTNVTPNSTSAHTLSAVVRDSNNTDCLVNSPPPFILNNSTQTSINVQQMTPPSATLPTNYNVDFSVPLPVITNGIDISPFVVFEWETSIGTVATINSGNIGRFSSGPASGSGYVYAKVKYGGQVLSRVASVQVNSPTNAPTSGGTTSITTSTTVQQPTSSTSAGTTSPATSGSTSSTTQPTLTTNLLQTDIALRQCLVASLGEARLKILETEQTRPTAEEFDKYLTCFTKKSFVVASTLAPVAPAEVKNLKVDKDKVSITKAENATVKKAGNEYKQLVFKGKGKPNSTVLLYVFSEPLVLATTAGSDGAWSYTLEDPLQPGSHEAYAMVNSGDGNYQRSSSFGFLIGKASASAANPKGYSLELGIAPTANQNNRSTNIFLFGVGAAVIFAAAGLMGFLGLKHKKNKASLASYTSAIAPTTAESTEANITPSEPPVPPTDPSIGV